MATLYATRGLPGSGKSTLAARLARQSGGRVKVVSGDALRLMLDGGAWGHGDRAVMTAARDALVGLLLAAGHDAIVDGTNLDPHYEHDLRALAERHGAAFAWLDLTDVPADVCIARDAGRARPVGADVIAALRRRYLGEETR